MHMLIILALLIAALLVIVSMVRSNFREAGWYGVLIVIAVLLVERAS